MRRRTGQWVLTLVLGVTAALGAPAAFPRTACEASLLVWQVTAPGAPDPAPDYLVGTIHLPVPASHTLPAAALAALKQSDYFICEVDSNKITKEVMRPWAVLRTGEPNSKRLPKAVWDRVQRQAKAKGIPADVADRLAPWFLCTLLSVEADKTAQQRDFMLRDAAQRQQIPIEYLESPDEQFKMLANLPLAMFDSSLKNESCMKEQFGNMATLYDRNDQASLARSFVDPEVAKQAPQVFDVLYFARNRRWLPKIELAMATHRAFVAVGLGHLLGERGLIAALKAKGYKVEQVPM